MEIYFGGAYNGKLEYVKKEFKLSDEEIFHCTKGEIDFSKKVINGIDKLIYSNSVEGKESLSYFKSNLESLKDKIIICDEISSGIVPLKKEERFWREETGRILQLLSKNSEKVTRIFFGIPTVIKNE
ncbi:bifunctional adenosylcobinamide kinase/adenosylcobinamide-phosphate guanylyltransferase [Clostridium sp.]|uniref:bifunctional adenosylcobinamide kinase/adenosylcobinamide-phosphate guanylyltransferase n=1 Tax=Clostridium sp. TaxID=1506 RepID=UPI003F2CA1C6